MGNNKAYKSAQKNEHGAEAQEKKMKYVRAFLETKRKESVNVVPLAQHEPKFEAREIQMESGWNQCSWNQRKGPVQKVNRSK